jgi:hypothetical protein
MSRSSLVSLTVAIASSVAVAGCGQSATEKRDLATARSIVHRFSESSDSKACYLLTYKAVRALYGKFTAPAAKARANCVRRSRSFRGEPVQITRSELLDPQTIKVNALGKDGKFSYQVNLRKGTGGRWHIDLVTQAKVTPF